MTLGQIPRCSPSWHSPFCATRAGRRRALGIRRSSARWPPVATTGDAGDVVAQFSLGSMLYYELHRHGCRWSSGFGRRRRSATPPAEFQIGQLYEFGLGVAQDDAVALDWYRKAADHGSAAGQRAVGDSTEGPRRTRRRRPKPRAGTGAPPRATTFGRNTTRPSCTSTARCGARLCVRVRLVRARRGADAARRQPQRTDRAAEHRRRADDAGRSSPTARRRVASVEAGASRCCSATH